jgi:hypothetical protein
MTRSHMMRHNLPVALLVASMLMLAPAASAQVDTPARNSTPAPIHARAIPRPICPIDWQRGPFYVRRLVLCAATYYHVPGGPAKALAIADRESRLYPRAYNRYSGAMGIYQHLARYWPGRAAAYGFRGWSGFNARANIIVTMKMVKQLGGWWPWGG